MHDFLILLAWLAVYLAPIALGVAIGWIGLRRQDRLIAAGVKAEIGRAIADPGVILDPLASQSDLDKLADRVKTLEIQAGSYVPLSQYEGLADTVSLQAKSLREFGDALAERPRHKDIDDLLKAIEAEVAEMTRRLAAAEARLKVIGEATAALADLAEGIPTILRTA